MAWSKTISLLAQPEAPLYDGRFPSITRPSLSGSATGFEKTISQHGVDFEFDGYVMTGEYVSGDPWAKDAGYGTELVRITPEGQLSAEDGTTKINGAMVNPVDSDNHGYDSRTPQDMLYDDVLNVDPGNTGSNLMLTPGDTVVKAISRLPSDGNRPSLTDSAMLTVVSEPPAIGSFRPAYNANTETILANESDLDYTQLANHPLLGDTPTISDAISSSPTVTYENLQDRHWLEHNTDWTAREIHAENHYVDAYGAYYTRPLAELCILLNMNLSQADKREMVIGVIQYALDIYSFVSTGSTYPDNGGHNMGRKLPLLVAARMLNNASMLAYCDKEQHFIFHDDKQTFYVSQDTVDVTNSVDWSPNTSGNTPEPYEVADIGTPEWGINHIRDNTNDNRAWLATYRNINNANIWRTALAVNLMGAEAQWNWPAYFDYADRMYGIDETGGSTWAHSVWGAYKV